MFSTGFVNTYLFSNLKEGVVHSYKIRLIKFCYTIEYDSVTLDETKCYNSPPPEILLICTKYLMQSFKVGYICFRHKDVFIQYKAQNQYNLTVPMILAVTFSHKYIFNLLDRRFEIYTTIISMRVCFQGFIIIHLSTEYLCFA